MNRSFWEFALNLFMKNRHFVPNYDETWSNWPTQFWDKLTKFHEDWAKFVDFSTNFLNFLPRSISTLLDKRMEIAQKLPFSESFREMDVQNSSWLSDIY